MNQTLKIAVAGLGTVGAGVVRLLGEHADILALRGGREIAITCVSARDRKRKRGVDLSNMQWYDDAADMAANAEVEVVVELIGGADGVAMEVCEAAIGAGRHVVTANKALLAHHGTSLAAKAEAAGVILAFEAAVAGAVPIVKALREGLAGNRIDRVYGILNGTSNYILSNMAESGRSFAEALSEAQALGYAEADPSFDVDGVDAAHKLAILTSLAFGCEIDFEGVFVAGIRDISPLDIEFADELGFRIKPLAMARRTEHGFEQRVHPCMVALDNPIAHVDGAFNAVVADGDFSGSTVYEGQGAGAGPTASAVAADLVDIARGRSTAVFGIPTRDLKAANTAPMERHRGPYYLRLMVVDRPGVVADITAALRDEQVSLESMLQRGRSPGAVPVVLTTHETEEAAMVRALARITKLETVQETPCMIRIENL